MTMFSLERITRQNALTFRDVRLQALQDTPSAFGSTYAKESRLTDDYWLERAAQWNGGSSTAFLAMDDTTPCGITGCFLNRDNALQAHLVSMWVSPSHRRDGIGRLLVNAVVDWACSQKVETLYLTVTNTNESAIKFTKVSTFHSRAELNRILMIQTYLSMKWRDASNRSIDLGFARVWIFRDVGR